MLYTCTLDKSLFTGYQKNTPMFNLSPCLSGPRGLVVTRQCSKGQHTQYQARTLGGGAEIIRPLGDLGGGALFLILQGMTFEVEIY